MHMVVPTDCRIRPSSRSESADSWPPVPVSVWEFIPRRIVDGFSDNFLCCSGGATNQATGRPLPVDEDSASFLVLLFDFNHLFAEPGTKSIGRFRTVE